MRPVHVLLIDGSSENRAEVRSMLVRGSDRDYRFMEAVTGAAGMRLLRDEKNTPPDCILFDYHLPDMTATEFLTLLRGGRELLCCPTVVMVGAQDGLGSEMLKAGAQDYVGKTWWTPASLVRTIENAMDRWVLLRERAKIADEMRLSEHMLQAVFDTAEEYLWVLAPNGNVHRANRAARSLADSLTGDAIGRRFWETIRLSSTGGAPDRVRAAVERMAPGESVRFDLALTTLAGDVIDLDITFKDVRNPEGNIILIVAKGRDVTVLRRREANLAFLADVTRGLALATSEEEVLCGASEKIARHLSLTHCMMVEINQAKEEATVLHDHHAPGTRSLVGVYRLNDFHTPAEIQDMGAGLSTVFNDIQREVSSPVARERFAALGVRSMATANYLSDGQWKFVLGAQRNVPCLWEKDVVEVLVELAERIYLRNRPRLERDRLEWVRNRKREGAFERGGIHRTFGEASTDRPSPPSSSPAGERDLSGLWSRPWLRKSDELRNQK